MKNILLVSLGNRESQLEYQYYYYEKEGTALYCDGLLLAEAGTKYVLSKVDLDEIVVIGSGATYDEGDERKKIMLETGTDFYSADPSSMSEYSFFRYRIAEYLQNVDVEEYEILSSISDDERDKLITVFNDFQNRLGKRTGKKRGNILFNRMKNEPAIYDELIEAIPESLGSCLQWMKRYVYSKLSESFKAMPLESNENVVVSFIPTQKDEDSQDSLINLLQIMEALQDGDEEIDLYIDMQGMQRSKDYTMITLFSILNNEWNNKIHLKEVVSAQCKPTDFAGKITNELPRYEMSNLLAGMNSFIQYGKVDMIQKYWEVRNIKSKHTEDLLFAMRCVDEGISLCNTSDLEYGIGQLKKVFAESKNEEALDEATSIFSVLEDGIKRDYGSLLEGDENDEIDVLELIKWAYRKKFYQQTLTIIESRIPRDFVNRGILYYARNKEDKKSAMKLFNDEFSMAARRTQYQFRDMDHYFIKVYGRFLVNAKQSQSQMQQCYAQLRIGELERDNPKLMKAYSQITDVKVLEELLYAYYYIGPIRNLVSHGNNGEKQYPWQRLMHKESNTVRLMKEAIDHFIFVYDAVKKELNDSSFEIEKITGQELRQYNFENKPKYNSKSKPPQCKDTGNIKTKEKSEGEGKK